MNEKRAVIEKYHPVLTIAEQCALLGINRSSYYYQEKGIDAETESLMKLLDRHYTEYPHEGKIKRALWLTEQAGYTVGKKRVSHLMQEMGLETVYPKPNTSVPDKSHVIYPYLLRDTEIVAPNQVWSTDITYIPLLGSHVYLMSIIDWYSRYVLGWGLSTTLEAQFCVEVLKDCLEQSRCEIFNSDQGSQFTSGDWIKTLTEAKISISMDGRGRYLDNIFVERLWRTVKQECVYLQDFQSVAQVKEVLNKYFIYYNNQRLHQALDYRTPVQVYYKH
jgi:putative transposase